MATTAKNNSWIKLKEHPGMAVYQIAIAALLTITVTVGTWGLTSFIEHEKLPAHPMAEVRLRYAEEQLQQCKVINRSSQKIHQDMLIQQALVKQELAEIKGLIKKAMDGGTIR
ncbi:MAG: hypothetical protein ACXAEN_14870 [Candidatus Thorarchaeota archaeon]|jgi:hypothetical protein